MVITTNTTGVIITSPNSIHCLILPKKDVVISLPLYNGKFQVGCESLISSSEGDILVKQLKYTKKSPFSLSQKMHQSSTTWMEIQYDPCWPCWRRMKPDPKPCLKQLWQVLTLWPMKFTYKPLYIITSEAVVIQLFLPVLLLIPLKTRKMLELQTHLSKSPL